jgi:hypothetical protein
MVEVTFEDAKRCPKCDNPGEDIETKSLGGKLGNMHVIRCIRELCPWYMTTWIIQVLPDGTIPVRPSRELEPRRPKTFPEIPGMTTERAQAEMKRIKDDDKS